MFEFWIVCKRIWKMKVQTIFCSCTLSYLKWKRWNVKMMMMGLQKSFIFSFLHRSTFSNTFYKRAFCFMQIQIQQLLLHSSYHRVTRHKFSRLLGGVVNQQKEEKIAKITFFAQWSKIWKKTLQMKLKALCAFPEKYEVLQALTFF